MRNGLDQIWIKICLWLSIYNFLAPVIFSMVLSRKFYATPQAWICIKSCVFLTAVKVIFCLRSDVLVLVPFHPGILTILIWFRLLKWNHSASMDFIWNAQFLPGPRVIGHSCDLLRRCDLVELFDKYWVLDRLRESRCLRPRPALTTCWNKVFRFFQHLLEYQICSLYLYTTTLWQPSSSWWFLFLSKR